MQAQWCKFTLAMLLLNVQHFCATYDRNEIKSAQTFKRPKFQRPKLFAGNVATA